MESSIFFAIAIVVLSISILLTNIHLYRWREKINRLNTRQNQKIQNVRRKVSILRKEIYNREGDQQDDVEEEITNSSLKYAYYTTLKKYEFNSKGEPSPVRYRVFVYNKLSDNMIGSVSFDNQESAFEWEREIHNGDVKPYQHDRWESV